MGKRRKGPAPFLPASAGGGNVNAAATSSMLALSSSLAGTRLSVPPSPYGSRGPKLLRREGREAQTGVSGWTQSRHLQQPAQPCCTSNTAYPHGNSHGTEQNNEVSFCPSSSNPEELRRAKAEPSSAAAAGEVRATRLLAGLLCCCLSPGTGIPKGCALGSPKSCFREKVECTRENLTKEILVLIQSSSRPCSLN